MKELCGGCSVVYANADGDAARQQQADSALAQGAKVIVLDPVDSTAAATIVSTAHAQDVRVIAYDRPILRSDADYYVSFDNERIGRLIASSLVAHLRSTGAEGGLLEINGSSTDVAAGLIKKGSHEAVATARYRVLAEYDSPNWSIPKAQEWAGGQIIKFGGRIAGVIVANDGLAGGAVAAFESAGVRAPPPITGNDAELAAVQRIVAGRQYNSISKPIKIVADVAAQRAYDFLQGRRPVAGTTLFNTPSELFTPTVVTVDNLQKVLIDSGQLKAQAVCTAEYAAACRQHHIG